MAKGDAARKAALKAQEEASLAEVAFIGVLVEKYPELRGFMQEIRQKIIASPTKTITDQEYASIQSKYDWFKKNDADRLAAEKQMAEDRLNGTNNYQAAVDLNRVTLKEMATQYGFSLDGNTLDRLANQMKYENWEPAEARAALQSQLESMTSGDFVGRAGDIQNQLQDWAAKNGLDIPATTLQRMIASGAFGQQSVDDMKAELRKTYLAGAFPAWGDKIANGADPYDLAAPYRAAAAKLLEVDEGSVGFNDPLLQKAMQGTGPDGKPTTVPLYEFQRMVRNDPRWQKTDNAYATYSSVADDVLKMFGFR